MKPNADGGWQAAGREPSVNVRMVNRRALWRRTEEDLFQVTHGHHNQLMDTPMKMNVCAKQAQEVTSR